MRDVVYYLSGVFVVINCGIDDCLDGGRLGIDLTTVLPTRQRLCVVVYELVVYSYCTA